MDPQLEGGSERQGNSSSEEPSGPSLPLRITRTWLTWPGKRGQPGPCGRGAYLYRRGPCRKPFLLAGGTSPGADLTRNADASSPYASFGWGCGATSPQPPPTQLRASPQCPHSLQPPNHTLYLKPLICIPQVRALRSQPPAPQNMSVHRARAWKGAIGVKWGHWVGPIAT